MRNRGSAPPQNKPGRKDTTMIDRRYSTVLVGRQWGGDGGTRRSKLVSIGPKEVQEGTIVETFPALRASRCILPSFFCAMNMGDTVSGQQPISR